MSFVVHPCFEFDCHSLVKNWGLVLCFSISWFILGNILIVLKTFTLVWEILVWFCLFFSLSAVYIKTVALTSRICFFDFTVIALVCLTVALTLIRTSALKPCPSARTVQSCYACCLVSAQLLRVTRADLVELNFVQFFLLNLLVWLSPALSTWFMTWFLLSELWDTCLRSLVPQGFVYCLLFSFAKPSSSLSLLGLYLALTLTIAGMCWIPVWLVLNSHPPGVCFSLLISHPSPRASSGRVCVKPSVGSCFLVWPANFRFAFYTCSVIVESVLVVFQAFCFLLFEFVSVLLSLDHIAHKP